MMQDSNIMQFWISKDPDYDRNGIVKNTGTTECWRSKSEPVFDVVKNCYTLTPEAKKMGDVFVHISSSTKAILPGDLLKQIKSGMKMHVTLQGMYELKDNTDNKVEFEEGLLKIDNSCFFQIVPFNDKLIFGYKGIAKLHERRAVMYTRQQNEEYPYREEYINEEGVVIRHDADESIYECYTVFGRSGDTITPLHLGEFWASDEQPDSSLEEILNEACNKGLHISIPPEDDTIEFGVRLLGNEIVTIYCKSGYYGFGSNMRFWTKRRYREEATLKTRSLERTICDAIVCYRQFFNRPGLRANVVFDHDPRLETESSWSNNKAYSQYMTAVKEYEKKKLSELNLLINSSVDHKYNDRMESR